MIIPNKTWAALLSVSSILGATASPVDKRQAASSSATPLPSAGLIVTTGADGKPTTLAAAAPTQLQPQQSSASGSVTGTPTAQDAATTASTTTSSLTFSPTRVAPTLVPSKDFPVCTQTDGQTPFCLPNENSTLYIEQNYYVTWNPDYFKRNSTLQIAVNWDNGTREQVWHSDAVPVEYGVVFMRTERSWLQGFSAYNLTMFAIMYEQADGTGKAAKTYDGPRVLLTTKPPDHYPPPPATPVPDKMSLLLGLPLGLGIPAIIIICLYLGFRKTREIGKPNIMSRMRHPWNRKGYAAGQSRRQRLGLGRKKKNGAIRLQERDLSTLPPDQVYRDEPAQRGQAQGHQRDVSLGSLVGDDDAIRPAPLRTGQGQGNAFRSEIERQRTGR